MPFPIFEIPFPISGKVWPICRNRVCMSGNGGLMVKIGCKPLVFRISAFQRFNLSAFTFPFRPSSSTLDSRPSTPSPFRFLLLLSPLLALAFHPLPFLLSAFHFLLFLSLPLALCPLFPLSAFHFLFFHLCFSRQRRKKIVPVCFICTLCFRCTGGSLSLPPFTLNQRGRFIVRC